MSAHHTVMSNAHATSTSLLFAFALVLGATSTAGCDTVDEATRARTAPEESCVADCEPEPDCIIDCDPEPQPPEECVMTHDRWVAKTFAAPEQEPVGLGGVLCSMTYDEILTAPRDTPWMKVAQQYVTARVNVGHGASLPDEVAAAMADAESFLIPCVPCPKVANTTVPALDTLTRYNAGKVGPDECECVIDCDECLIDCDDEDGIDLCPAKVFGFRAL